MRRPHQRGRSGVPGVIAGTILAMREMSRELGVAKIRSQPREV